MPKISLILPTAREDYPLLDLPTTHMFEPTVRSLEAQTFKDFELIVVDALHERRKDYFQNRTSFPVRHVPPKPNPWHAKKLWAVASQFNTGLLYARGELVVSLGDCCELSPPLLERFWSLHQRGFLAQAMFIYYRGGLPAYADEQARQAFARAREAVQTGLGHDEFYKSFAYGSPICDTRLPIVRQAGGSMNGRMDEWWYGYGAAPMEAYLAVNGFDEAFDGSKSLEDCDLGSRFAMAGYGKLHLSTDLLVVEHGHGPISPEIIASARAMKANWAIFDYNRKFRRVRANTGPFSAEALAYIKQMTCSSTCSHAGGSEYDLGEAFDWWAKNIPSFNLRDDRARTLAAL